VHLSDILWQNRLIGTLSDDGVSRFFSLDDVASTNLRSVSSSLDEYCGTFYGADQQDDRPLVRLVLPKSLAPAALRDLEMMGITSESMFPGLEGAARFAFVTAVDRHIWRET
jgi:hypothetical protein